MKKGMFKKRKPDKINTLKETFLEYTPQSDTNHLKSSLNKDIRKLKLKNFLLIFYLILYISSVFLLKNNLTVYGFKVTPQIYLIFSIFLLSISILTCSNFIYNGIISIFKLKFNSDTVLIITWIIAFARSLLLLIFEENCSIKSTTYAGIVILSFLFNNIFYFLIKKRIIRNFKFILSSNQKYKINLYDKNNNQLKNLSLFNIQNLILTFRNKITFVSNFFENSYIISFWDKIISRISPVYILLSIAIGITSITINHDIIYCFTGMLVFLLICFPISFLMCLNSHLNSTCKTALKKGAMITNFETIKKFSCVNAVFLDASTLYPANNVILKEIKTFRGQRVDEAILAAATLVCAKKGTLTSVFNKIIMGKKNLLTKASNVIYEDEKGIVGWVNGQQAVIGNREILKEYGVDPPSRDYENKYRKDNEGLTYIAIGRDLVAMFILEYKPNKKVQNDLLNAGKNKINIFIRTSDSNINIDRIIKDFQIPSGNINILPYEESIDLETFEEETPSSSNSELATMGSYESLLRAICLCKKANTSFLLTLSIHITSLVLALSIVTSLTLLFTLDRVGEITISIYILFWTIASLITPKINRN